MASSPDPQGDVQDRGIQARWENLVHQMGLDEYYPCKLSLQVIRTIQMKHKDSLSIHDVPFRVLQQLLFMDSTCRTSAICEVVEHGKKGRKRTGKFGRKSQSTEKKTTFIPHPMDLLLLVFVCSDSMLRQVIAHKLFVCRLAIPFIIPCADESLQMLIWPLRQIALEWRNKHNHAVEESLVRQELTMLGIVRLGKVALSKSKLINNIVSKSNHPTFFHNEAQLGKEKRLISNGMIEMTHSLPSGTAQDCLTEPTLIFNLRGDGCEFLRQTDILCSISSVLLVLIDLSELDKEHITKSLCNLVQQKTKIAVLLTDKKGCDVSEIDSYSELITNLIGEDCAENIITSFEEEGGQRNPFEVIEDVIGLLNNLSQQAPLTSIEKLKEKLLHEKTCDVDEASLKECHDGIILAGNILDTIENEAFDKRKQLLLPCQGDCLNDMGDLLRKLHRTGRTDRSSAMKKDLTAEKERIKQEIASIRRRQTNSSNISSQFMAQILSVFKEEGKMKDFAICSMQLELDRISRTEIPKLQDKKSLKWEKLEAARTDGNEAQITKLDTAMKEDERQLANSMFGMEHILREIGQVYEAYQHDNQYDAQTEFLPGIVARRLLDGYPIEIMDGDHGFLPDVWVKAVLQCLADIVGARKRIFVLSVLGVQSTGKSTLLNAMFGLEFAVSAGRCTRGIYGQMIPVQESDSELPFDFLFVLDSEGLRAQELGSKNFEHDNELATLAIGLADLAIINLKGENTMEMTDILQIVVHSFLRMKAADCPHKRQCMFIHQNVAAVNALEKSAQGQQKLQEQLNQMTQEAAEAQGYGQTITTFNKVISFNGRKHVLYFSDLWSGDPPMATINPGYSSKAAMTKQNILQEIKNNYTDCISISDFITRLEDMLLGVLSDDFVFSFRNSLAVKAFIGLERTFSKLIMAVENDTHQWLITTCKKQIEVCTTTEVLNHGCKNLLKELRDKISHDVKTKHQELCHFFETHSNKDIIIQWKEEKLASFRLCAQSLQQQTEMELNNMKQRKIFQIQQAHDASHHEQEILRKALTLAKEKKGMMLSDKEQEDSFELLWQKWFSDLSPHVNKPQELLPDFLRIISDKFQQEGNLKYIEEEINRLSKNPQLNPDSLRETITGTDIGKDYIMVKEVAHSAVAIRNLSQLSECLPEAIARANAILKKVLEHLSATCSQDTEYSTIYGRKVIDLLFEEVKKHNDLSRNEASFTFNTQFVAKLTTRVACIAAHKFEAMNSHFVKKYGIRAMMEEYKSRVFLTFKNAIKQTSEEVKASDDFCEVIRSKLVKLITEQMDTTVFNCIVEMIGSTKHELLVRILENICQGTFKELHDYISEPYVYAVAWLQDFSEGLLFFEKDGCSLYGKEAETIAGAIFGSIKRSVRTASDCVVDVKEEEKYAKWISKFCDAAQDAFPVSTAELQSAIDYNIKNFDTFHDLLQVRLSTVEKEIQSYFYQFTRYTVKWNGMINPYERAIYLWGCTELCPFCEEPCQMSDPQHTGPHRCIQHRPSGIGGTRHRDTNELELETCCMKITDRRALFTCSSCNRQCRSSEHCKAIGAKNNDHHFREYKKYLPDWDIPADPSGEAAKYWKFLLCKFEEHFLELYPGTKLTIPKSWRDITEGDALTSLRVFH